MVSSVGTRHHLAVVGGPDVGWVVPLPEDREVVIGRGEVADLTLADPRLSRRHLGVRDRRGRITARPLTHARVTVRQARRTRTGRTRLGPRRRLHRRTPLHPGAQIAVAGTVLELREHPGLAAPPHEPELTDGLGTRLLVPLVMSATMLPFALSSGAQSPWRALTWLILPLALVLAVIWPWLRERAARRPRRDQPDGDPPDPPDPPGLLAVADLPAAGPVPDWDVGTDSRPRRRRPRVLSPPSPGRGLALVGEQQACQAMARWLVCQAAHQHTPTDLRVIVPHSWDWARSLPHTGASAATLTLRVIQTSDQEPAGAPASDAVGIVLAPSLAEVPTWCTRVVELHGDHGRMVSVAWAHEVATAIAHAARDAGDLPRMLPLSDLVGEPGPHEVLHAWQHQHPGLAAPLGASPDGPLWLDLADAGPHALVAGTTGSGKSELLTTWVLGLALRHAPREVQVLLVDYKGGATFGALAELPHVVDVLTDLDAGTTARALASLRAELARRERVLASAGARSLAELPGVLARLLVVVDEFRTLADAHPDLLDALVRLAAQGRSLGIHLVLATQRPAGAITADMRANVSVRVCLRVLEPTDSHDVLGDDAAARLAPVPGRAVVRTDVATTVQVAWPGTLDDGVARLVSTLRLARGLAEDVDPALVQVQAPWAPPLPATISTADLPEVREHALPLLLADLPQEQRVASQHLDPGDSLLISGPPRSGRSTAARTVAIEAVRRGIVTHVIAAESLLPSPAQARGTTCAPDEVRRVHRLLCALEQPRPRGDLLVIDDVDALCRALDGALPFGAGLERMVDLLRTARRRGLGVVLTADPPAARWAAVTGAHLVLAPRDVSDALVAGVPRELVPLGAPPGRGVLLEGANAVVGQVAIAPERGPWPAPRRAPLRVQPLPGRLALPAPLGADPDHPLLGMGGDDLRPVRLPLRPGGSVLILGASRSGRTTTVRMLTARLRAAGRTVWTRPEKAAAGGSGVLVVDDVDRLPATVAAVPAEVTVIAAARPEPLSAAFHDLARRLRDPDAVLVLGQGAGATPWTAIDTRPFTDPEPHPGRAVLVTAGVAVALQVDRGAPAQSTAPEEPEEDRLVAATEAGSSSPTPTTTEATIVG